MELAALEERLGYSFVQRTLIEQAVTHRSHGAVHNERLEFLGDAVLNCAVAQLLYAKYARLNEGDLSRLRSNLVKQSSLADIAEKLVLSEFMRLGEGEMKSGGWRRASVLADAFEAVIGAIYLDSDFESAKQTCLHVFAPLLADLPDAETLKDAKTRLQEWLQGRGRPLPLYDVVSSSGPAHRRSFLVRCQLADAASGIEAEGGSRRAAEQSAAGQMLLVLQASAVNQHNGGP